MLKPQGYKDIKVLYVEDEEKARVLILEIFNKFFQNIDIAIDGIDGLNKSKKTIII